MIRRSLRISVVRHDCGGAQGFEIAQIGSRLTRGLLNGAGSA